MIHVPPLAWSRPRAAGARYLTSLEMAARNWKVAITVRELTGVPTRTMLGLAIGMGLAGLISSARIRIPPGATPIQKIAAGARRRGNRMTFGASPP